MPQGQSTSGCTKICASDMSFNISPVPQTSLCMCLVHFFCNTIARVPTYFVNHANKTCRWTGKTPGKEGFREIVRGGGVSWHFNFAWEISRFKLTAKFPTRNSGFSANFSYTGSTHCGLRRGQDPLNPGGSAKFPTAKFTIANLTWRKILPPPPVGCGAPKLSHPRVVIDVVRDASVAGGMLPTNGRGSTMCW